MGGYPPSFGAFPRGGSQSVRPLLTHHKKASLIQSTQTDFFHAMFWGWCGLLVLIGASSVRASWSDPSSVPPVAACWSIKRVCTRPWPSVRKVLRPRAHTANKPWILVAFDACVGVCRVSGVHGLNVPSPLCPPHAHSYHGVYLQIMDPPSSAGHPDDDDRVSGTHRLNSSAPLAPASRVPVTPCSLFLCSFHLGASTTTTTTTTTIVTTPRRQAIAGNPFFVHDRDWAVM